MYTTRPGLILPFHGCDQSVVDDVITGTSSLEKSTNKYDWLGNGIYFWDNSPSRALQYANFLSENPKIAKRKIIHPAVIGAIINPGFYLNLLDYENLQILKEGYEILKATTTDTSAIPENKTIGSGTDLLSRELDCSVIETLHTVRKQSKLPPFDSVRGVFWEGDSLYPNAGFREKDHIQICIRNPNCIKGYFLPRIENNKYRKL